MGWDEKEFETIDLDDARRERRAMLIKARNMGYAADYLVRRQRYRALPERIRL